MESWPIVVGQEKRYDGRPAQSQAWIFGSSTCAPPELGGNPADGGRPYSRRAALGRLLQRAAKLEADRRTPGPQQQPLAVGNGQVKVGLILPLSASGNAGVAAQSMKNAAEMALAEFQNPNVQLLIKDDGGNPQGAQQGTQQALAEGAEIILGPLFAVSVPATAQLTRAEGHLRDRVLDRFQASPDAASISSVSCLSPMSTGSSITPRASESARSRHCCPTMPMAMWWRPPSSRRSAARAGASSRLKNTAPTARPRRARWRSRSVRPTRC